MKAGIAGATLAVALVAVAVAPAAAEKGCGRICEHKGPFVDDSRWQNPPEFGNSLFDVTELGRERALDGGLLGIIGP